MALSREAGRLRRLQLIAQLLRDRDLGAVAAALARRRETDQQIEDLKAHDTRIRADLATASDVQDMLQAQAHCRLIDAQMAGLVAEQRIRAAAAEAGLKAARRSFSRATVADALGEAEAEKQRTKSARRDER